MTYHVTPGPVGMDALLRRRYEVLDGALVTVSTLSPYSIYLYDQQATG